MATQSLSVFLLLVVILAAPKVSSAASVDLTRSPGAKGQAVVEAVVDLIHQTCIFENDKDFLRRLAYVESRDGANGNTYRSQYDGGIWQVDEDKFLSTKTLIYSRTYFSAIRIKFGIEWLQVTWHDLRKPLYSGLAARLLLEVILQNADIPSDSAHQALLWHPHYHTSHPAPTANFTAAARLLESSCHETKKLDVVFLLDASGSVDISDFTRAKEFVVQWINAFTLGPDATRVGAITYSDLAIVNIYLPNYENSKTDLIKQVRAMGYGGGGTATGEAIDLAVTKVLSTRFGARSQVSRAIILITDGQSNLPSETLLAADRAKQAGITLFPVGVGGNVNDVELNGIASQPKCMHVFHVDTYGEIDALIRQMQEASCKTAIHLSTDTSHPQSNNTNSTKPIENKIVCELDDKCDPISVKNTNSTGSNSTSGKAIVTSVNCGSATVYASYKNPNPGVAYYELKAVATNNTPAVLVLNDNGKTLYISVEGHPVRIDRNHTLTCEAVTTITDTTELPAGTGEVEVVCTEWGKERECTIKDLEKFKHPLCEETFEFTNPCSRSNLLNGELRFTYHQDNEKYLMCDLVGNVYVVRCPKGHVYNPVLKTCGLSTGSPGHTTGSRSPLDSKETNPCTVNAMLEGHMQFAYVKDNTKFIICDVWGGAWLYECHDGFIWDSRNMQCVVKQAAGHIQGPGPLDKGIANPCTADNIREGHLFFAYPLSTDRYIQCDTWGDAFVMLCFTGGHWSVLAGACTAGNIG